MNNVNTKFYSSMHESAIANYLNWSVVSGSGARPCCVADIESDEFLGECKTHVRPQKVYTFVNKVWAKLLNESMFAHRYPALFVDDGHQTFKTTLVAIPQYAIPDEHLDNYSVTAVAPNSSSVTISAEVVEYDNSNVIYSSKLENSKVYIMPCKIFKSILEA